MKIDLETAKRFFASSPFMVDLGVEPVAVGEGTMVTLPRGQHVLRAQAQPPADPGR